MSASHTHAAAVTVMAALASWPLRRLRTLSRGVSRSCAGPQPPSTPVCASPPPPACRPRRPEQQPRGVRIVCCAPPQGRRPPCLAPAPAPPLSCARTESKYRVLSCVQPCEQPVQGDRCGGGQDRVARRLDEARAARRADYEREAADRAPAAAAPLAPYELGTDRECARATDGRRYVLPCAPPPAAGCGPQRTPPPPRCFLLRRDDSCRISDGGRLDPCSEQPRVFIEIDRGASAHSTAPPSPSAARSRRDTSTPETDQPPVRSLTSRIMYGLGRGRRGGGDVSGRKLHTSAVTAAHAKPGGSESKSTSIDEMLRRRSALAEAGRGRVAAPCPRREPPVEPCSGRLVLPVPYGAARVSVHVDLDAAPGPGCATPAAPATSPISSPSSVPSPNGSWLSIKTIGKRISGCRRPEAKCALSKCGPNQPKCIPPQPTPPKQRPQSSPCIAPMESKTDTKPNTTKPKCPTDTTKCSSTLALLAIGAWDPIKYK